MMHLFLWERLFENMILLCLLSPLITANCNGTYRAVNINGAYPQILPRPGSRMAVGYDALTGTTIILGGGGSYEQYITFNQESAIFHDEGESYMTNGVYGTGQFYSQLDDMLWMINDNSPGFVTMNTQTRDINSPSITIPTDVDARGCLATIKYNDNQYLFVVGGWNSDDGYLNLIQVYNVTSQDWNNLTSMQTARRSAACIVHQTRLYVIGGKSAGTRVSSIESMDVTNALMNIANQEWIYTNGNLKEPMDSCIAVSYENDIIVFGGINNNGIYPTDINTIDTLTNTVNVDGCLVRGIMNAAVIVVDNMLYGYGGRDINGSSDQYQYINLYPTSNPTNEPTLIFNPTNQPTINPSLFPTSSAFSTSNPSSPPTLNPSSPPTSTSKFTTIVTSNFAPTNYPTSTSLLSATVTTLSSSETSNSTFNTIDMISTLSVENKEAKKAGIVDNMLIVFIIVCICIVCICIIVILCLYASKSEKQNNASNEDSNNVNIQLSHMINGPNVNTQISDVVLSSSSNLIDVPSDDMDVMNDMPTQRNPSGDNCCSEDDIDIGDIIIHNNIVTIGFINDENNGITKSDNGVTTLGFNNITNDEFIVEGEEDIQITPA